MDRETLRELTRAPGVGPSIDADLETLGVRSLADLARADPEELYQRLETQADGHVDRCVLYVFRCAHYFAAHTRHDPELLEWWRWKDRG